MWMSKGDLEEAVRKEVAIAMKAYDYENTNSVKFLEELVLTR
jgi:hypothetical protein